MGPALVHLGGVPEILNGGWRIAGLPSKVQSVGSHIVLYQNGGGGKKKGPQVAPSSRLVSVARSLQANMYVSALHDTRPLPTYLIKACLGVGARGGSLSADPQPCVESGAIKRYALDLALMLACAFHAVSDDACLTPFERSEPCEEGEGRSRPLRSTAVAQELPARGIAEYARLGGEVLLYCSSVFGAVSGNSLEGGTECSPHVVYIPPAVAGERTCVTSPSSVSMR